MLSTGRAYTSLIGMLFDEILELIGDIPEDDLNTWKPAAATTGGQEMNTFAAQCVHVASTASFLTLHGVGGQPMDRDREAEFVATASRDEIGSQFSTFQVAIGKLVATLDDADLEAEPAIGRWSDLGWRKGEVLLHVIDHTAAHLGHMQIQKQLWIVERAVDGGVQKLYPQ